MQQILRQRGRCTWFHDAAFRCGVRLDPMICTPRKSESLMIWTTLAPKLTPFGTSGCNANHINAGAHLLPEAGATQERTLEAVRCSARLCENSMFQKCASIKPMGYAAQKA